MTLPIARIARVSWWRRVLAWLRALTSRRIVIVARSERQLAVPRGPWRCPPCLYQVGIDGCVYCRRPHPVTMPTPGDGTEGFN